MSSRESYMVERIDRSREAPAVKAARSARAMFLRMQARLSVTALLRDLPDPGERAIILEDLIDVAAEHLHPITGRVSAATKLNSVAADICATFRLNKAVQRANAERVFAANDRGRG